LLVLAVAVLLLCAGGYLGQATMDPRVIVNHEIHMKYKVIESVVYKPFDRVIESVVYKPINRVKESVVYRPVEKVVIRRVETPQPLYHFQSVLELEQWLENFGQLYIRFDVAEEETGQLVKEFDCDDYALRLQEEALRDGYIISFEVIRSEEYNSLFEQKRLPRGATHAVNSVIVGNEVYYIEPQTSEIVFAAYLD
jgi:hypothetical protein